MFRFSVLAFEDVSPSRCVIFDWFKCFKVGRISIEDDHGFGCRKQTNDTFALVPEKIKNNHEWLPELAHQLVLFI